MGLNIVFVMHVSETFVSELVFDTAEYEQQLTCTNRVRDVLIRDIEYTAGEKIEHHYSI